MSTRLIWIFWVAWKNNEFSRLMFTKGPIAPFKLISLLTCKINNIKTGVNVSLHMSPFYCISHPAVKCQDLQRLTCLFTKCIDSCPPFNTTSLFSTSIPSPPQWLPHLLSTSSISLQFLTDRMNRWKEKKNQNRMLNNGFHSPSLDGPQTFKYHWIDLIEWFYIKDKYELFETTVLFNSISMQIG